MGTSLSLAMNKKMAQKIAVGGVLHDMIAQAAKN